MKRFSVLALLLAVAVWTVSGAIASDVVLQELAVNVNGTFTDNPDVTQSPYSSTLDPITGLGTLSYTFDPGSPGTYYFDAFFDYEAHVPFFNEYGAVSGSPAAGQSWQIDASFDSVNRTSTIFGNTQNNTLDNTNWIPGQQSNYLNDCVGSDCNDDVAMAMGFNYTLAPGEFAVITFNISQTAPGSGFYLQQIDPDTPSSVYLSGNVSVQTGGPPGVPEPGSLMLAFSGLLAGAAALRRGMTR